MARNISIRHAERQDISNILDLVVELAVYEKEPHAVKASLAIYQDSFERGHFRALVAEAEGKVIGIALYYHRFSTWRGPMLYLEDFVVTQSHRRQGVGKLLFEAFVNEARRQGMSMVMWQVLDWNEPAINFYKKQQAIFDQGWINVKIFLDSGEP